MWVFLTIAFAGLDFMLYVLVQFFLESAREKQLVGEASKVKTCCVNETTEAIDQRQIEGARIGNADSWSCRVAGDHEQSRLDASDTWPNHRNAFNRSGKSPDGAKPG